jgi:hypothetical protein
MDVWHDGDVGQEVEVESENTRERPHMKGADGGDGGAYSKAAAELKGDLGGWAGDDPGLARAIQELATVPLADSTMGNYRAAMDRFIAFCKDKNYDDGDIKEQAIIHYITQLHRDQAGLGLVCQFGPALTLWLEMKYGDASRFTARARRILEGAKRKAAQPREPVKKAGEVTLELLKDLVEKYVTAYKDNIFMANIFRLWMVTRLAVEYFTFCRLADYRQCIERARNRGR